MKKLFVLVTFLCVIVTNNYASSPHVIVLPLEKYPSLPRTNAGTPADWSVGPVTQGIYANYFGYISTSNPSSEVIFPRKHNDSSFTLTIANTIVPVPMLQNTLSGFRIPEKTACKHYLIERKKDPLTELFFWEVAEATLPKDRVLPLNSITIWASPEEIYVPLGVSVTNNSPQLCLPPIFVKPGIRTAQNALSALDVRRFFEPVQRTFKTDKADVQSKLAPKTS